MANEKHCKNCGGFETNEGTCGKCHPSLGTIIPGTGEPIDVLEKVDALKGTKANRRKIFRITAQIPTVILPGDEYAHIMREIATNMPKEQRNQPIVTMAIANCYYKFENHGFGEYRIIDITYIDEE